MDEAASRIKTRGLTTPPYLLQLDEEVKRTKKAKKKLRQMTTPILPTPTAKVRKTEETPTTTR